MVDHSLEDVMLLARTGRCVLPLECEVPAAWLSALVHGFSIRCLYVLEQGGPAREFEFVAPSTSGADDFTGEAGAAEFLERELSADDLGIFLDHFTEVCLAREKEVARELLKSRPRLQAIWDKISVKRGSFLHTPEGPCMIASLLMQGNAAYPEIGVADPALILWLGYDIRKTSVESARVLKDRWISAIFSAQAGPGPRVALVHHGNGASRRFFEKLGFRIRGVSVRWEGGSGQAEK